MAFLRKQPIPPIPPIPHRFFPTCPLGAACGTRTMSAASREPPTPKAAIRTALRAAVRMPEQPQLCPPAPHTAPEATPKHPNSQPSDPPAPRTAPEATPKHPNSQPSDPPAAPSALRTAIRASELPAGDRPPPSTDATQPPAAVIPAPACSEAHLAIFFKNYLKIINNIFLLLRILIIFVVDLSKQRNE